MFKDYYKILGISQSASEEEIRRAYHKMSMRWHPDKNPDMDVTSIMQDINEAYAILKDADKRRRYDSEYILFRETESGDDWTECKEGNKQEKQTWTYDYAVKDEHLKEDISQARRYAKDLVDEFFRELRSTSKTAVKGAASTALQYAIGWIVGGFLLFLLIKACN